MLIFRDAEYYRMTSELHMSVERGSSALQSYIDMNPKTLESYPGDWLTAARLYMKYSSFIRRLTPNSTRFCVSSDEHLKMSARTDYLL